MQMIRFMGAARAIALPAQSANAKQTRLQNLRDDFRTMGWTSHGVYLTGNCRMVNPDGATTALMMRTSTASPRSAELVPRGVHPRYSLGRHLNGRQAQDSCLP